MPCSPAKRRRRLAAAALVLLGALLAGAGPAPEPIRWRELRPGLELAFLENVASTRSGSARVALLRVDPARYSFRVLAAPAGQAGLTAEQWREASGALAVFNAGQYTAERKYLGHLMQDGKTLSRPVAQQDGLFLAEPTDPGLPPARVIDQRYTAYDPASSPYRQAAQSLMLVDRFGQVRVRRSNRVAFRTAVAEDEQGRILVMVTEGGHTLWELAHALLASGLGLREVMSMDGGPESQLDIKTDKFRYQQFGRAQGSPDLSWLRQPLPAALAILPRELKSGKP
ncbi:MAG: phosphodiester glycosidase family protein [Thermodesulfobacteriota bacterium]